MKKDNERNTVEFKAFKLHSDSTLKSFTKSQLLDYIHMLYHNWKVTDEWCANLLKSNHNLGKWIPVEKKTPGNNEIVLTLYNDKRFNSKGVLLAYICDGSWYYDDDEEVIGIGITAWMPLPIPYEGGNVW